MSEYNPHYNFSITTNVDVLHVYGINLNDGEQIKLVFSRVFDEENYCDYLVLKHGGIPQVFGSDGEAIRYAIESIEDVFDSNW